MRDRQKVAKGPYDTHVAVPQRGEFSGRVTHVQEVKVPDVLKQPRTQSEAPRTVGTFDRRSKAPITQQHTDTRPTDPRTVPSAHTKFSGAGDIRPKQSTPAPPKSGTLVAQKAMDPLEEEHRRLTDKLRRRAQGGGKRAARRSQLAAFGKATAAQIHALYRPRDTRPRDSTGHIHDRPHLGMSNREKTSLQSNRMAARTPQPVHVDPTHAKDVTKFGFVGKPSKGKKVPEHVNIALQHVGKAESMKSVRVMSVSDYYNAMMKAEGGAPSAPGTPSTKKFPRKEKPTVKMKPISDQEASTNLRAGKFYEKSILVKLAAIKALIAGYGKVSGGDALRAANRGSVSVEDLNRAMEAMPKPGGKLPPATTYLPGVHGPEVKERATKMRSKASKRSQPAVKACGGHASSLEEPTLKKKKNVVHKSQGDASMSKTNFNDLFKSELGIPNDEHLVDCPHCEAPITKSDIATANAKGRTMAGGDGRGQVSQPRGVPGAKKTDEVCGVQNSKGSKGSKAHKSDAGSFDDDDDGGVEKGDYGETPAHQPLPPKREANPGRVSMRGVAQAQAESKKAPDAPKPVQVAQKGMSVRGSDFVQYVDYDGAPGSDAAIAKSIAEAQGALGQQATQPMDLNNDLSRLLV